jgi:glycosyltransferase involved in cell wall biosynthesis
VELIQKLDIGIMPLMDDAFERGKCGYKLIQYMACGLPVVASPVGINQKIIKHGENGFLASKEDEWIEAITLLIENPKLRKEMGLKGREIAEQEYAVQVTAPKIINLINQIVNY